MGCNNPVDDRYAPVEAKVDQVVLEAELWSYASHSMRAQLRVTSLLPYSDVSVSGVDIYYCPIPAKVNCTDPHSD